MKNFLQVSIVAISCFIFVSACNAPPTTDQPTASASPKGQTAASAGRPQAQDQLISCKSSLKNLGTAMEMYSVDWSGAYPSDVGDLTPNYLNYIPNCPVADTAYDLQTGPDVAYNDGHYQDYYFFQCRGGHHTAAGLQGDFPAYDGLHGIVDNQALLDSKKKAHEEAAGKKE